jgi:flagellar hook-length control protein FliK
VRQALEAALPQLRDMLAGSGIQLGDASVNAQSSNADPGPHPGHAGHRGAVHGADADSMATMPSIVPADDAQPRRGNGLIDLFA